MLQTKVSSALKEYFSPEFLNRIDDIIVFNKLIKKDIVKITRLLLDEYVNDLKLKNINITYSDDLAEFIADKGFSDKFGARPLKRAIMKYIEDDIALGYIKGKVKEKSSYHLDIDKEKQKLVMNKVK